MEFKYIEAFLEIVEKGSFSVAAESLFITQPTISSRIQRLEQEVGIVLFERNGGKKATLTPLGEQIHPYFKEGFRAIREGLESVKQSPLDKQIRLACPNHMGQYILPTVLKALYLKFPDKEFPLNIMVSSQIIENLRNAESDVGFVYLESMKDDKDLIYVPVTREETLLVCAPFHPFAKRKPMSVADIKEERIVIYAKTFITNIIIDDFLKKHGLPEYKTIEIKNIEWMKKMIENGLGISFLQRNIVSKELESGKLVEVPLLLTLPTTPISLLFRKHVAKDIRTVIIETANSLFNDELG